MAAIDMLSRMRTPRTGVMLPQRHLRPKLYLFLFLADFLSLALSYRLATAPIRPDLTPGDQLFAAATITIYLAIAFNGNGYCRRCLTSAVKSCGAAISALSLTMLVLLPIEALTGIGAHLTERALAVWLAAALVLILAHRIGMRRYVQSAFRHGIVSEILIVDGDDPPAACRGGILRDAESLSLVPDLADPEMVNRIGRVLSHFDRAVICCAPDKRADWACVLKGIDTIGEIMTPDLAELEPLGMTTYRGVPTVVVARDALQLSDRARKRAFDIIVSALALAILAVPMLALALAVRLDSPGPALFRQKRLGCGNRMFGLLKFRSMHVDRGSADGAVSASREDQRVTRLGRFIRSTSLDELPQLINVLRGDMSLVGPRPHALGSTAEGRLFWEIDRHYWHRHALKPGITGLAQLRGLRGATEKEEQLVHRLQSDLEYVGRWSLLRDAAILVGTARVLVHRNAF